MRTRKLLAVQAGCRQWGGRGVGGASGQEACVGLLGARRALVFNSHAVGRAHAEPMATEEDEAMVGDGASAAA